MVEVGYDYRRQHSQTEYHQQHAQNSCYNCNMHKGLALKKSEADCEEFLHSLGVCFVNDEHNDMIVTFNHDIMMRDNDLSVTN